MKHIFFCILLLVAAFMTGCQRKEEQGAGDALVIEEVGYPQAVFHDGNYYFTIQSLGGDSVELFCTADLTCLSQAERRTVWSTQRDTMTHFWSPEIHRVNDKWYLYFEGDDGNTDNHHLFVMECEDENPMKGEFVMRGALETRAEWNYGIHPNLLQLPSGELYLLWSGWPKRRAETETQCIYIAKMENPWTICSDRVMISMPEYEWERQWINPDGNRSAYPIFVNENPEAFLSPDGQHVVVLYSASGIWTVYTSLGMLSAPAKANLLNPDSWTKNPEPVLLADTITNTCITNAFLVPTPDGNSWQMLYELKRREQGNIVRDTYLRPINWGSDGMPQLDRRMFSSTE